MDFSSEAVLASVGTLVVVVVVAAIFYFVDKKLKKMVENQSKIGLNSMITLTLVNRAINTFEKSLRKSFNDAMEDGVITKQELILIIATTASDVKDEIINVLREDINETGDALAELEISVKDE